MATAETPTAVITKSYTELGTQYELHIQQLLTHTLGITSRHIGGRADGGIDLRGDWLIDSTDNSVLVQCKNISARCAPVLVREFEGVLSRYPESVGILVCTTSPSELARVRIRACLLPMMYWAVPFGGEEAVDVEVSEGLRRKMPEFRVLASIYTDYQSGRRLERHLFTYKGRQLGRVTHF